MVLSSNVLRVTAAVTLFAAFQTADFLAVCLVFIITQVCDRPLKFCYEDNQNLQANPIICKVNNYK